MKISCKDFVKMFNNLRWESTSKRPRAIFFVPGAILRQNTELLRLQTNKFFWLTIAARKSPIKQKKNDVNQKTWVFLRIMPFI